MTQKGIILSADKDKVLTNGKIYTKQVMLVTDGKNHAWTEVSETDEAYQAYLKREEENRDKASK
ncbi:MAG: hypothetical protein MJZ32_02715 [Bacteroidaceae bacterium]|nr:hypothetical protein [Bacteroidaceae bacterium]